MPIGFINLPLPVRLAIVALLAIVAARCVNWAIYNWAYFKTKIGPWTKPEGKTRSWLDHLPVIGWYRLRDEIIAAQPKENEANYVARKSWLRPLLIELCFPIFVAGYYWFYVSGGALPPGTRLPPGTIGSLHFQFVAHFILFILMAIATFIDFDEQSIPDYVTVPGTVIGLVGAAVAPVWLPFDFAGPGIVELQANTPGGWVPWLDGPYGLGIGLLILIVWGIALLDRRWIARRGWAKALKYFFARMFRHKPLWFSVLLVTASLMAFVTFVWFHWNPGRWQFLLSSLLGLAFAGGVTWGVRLSASAGLGVEALGFGDVTLMAMIGTYVGWQPSLIIFFIAPMVSMLFVLVRWIITGDAATPYGPYLCAATILMLVFWDRLWTNWAGPMFELGTTIVGIVVACVFLMGAMLWIWRLIKSALGLAGH